MRKATHPEPVDVTRKRFEDRIAVGRAAAERARAGGAARIANDFELQARAAEKELAALDRIANQPIETPAGIVSVGDRIRVNPGALCEAGDELVEVEVVEVWANGRIKTDLRLEGGPLGPMPVMIEPEAVVEVLEPEGD